MDGKKIMGIYISLCYKPTALTGDDADYDYESIECGKLMWDEFAEFHYSEEFGNLYDACAFDRMHSNPVKMLKEWENHLEHVLYYMLTHHEESVKILRTHDSRYLSLEEVDNDWYYPYLESVQYELDQTRKAIKEARRYKKLGYSVWASLG